MTYLNASLFCVDAPPAITLPGTSRPGDAYVLLITIISSVFAWKFTFISIPGFDCLICLSYHERSSFVDEIVPNSTGQSEDKRQSVCLFDTFASRKKNNWEEMKM